MIRWLLQNALKLKLSLCDRNLSSYRKKFSNKNDEKRSEEYQNIKENNELPKMRSNKMNLATTTASSLTMLFAFLNDLWGILCVCLLAIFCMFLYMAIDGVMNYCTLCVMFSMQFNLLITLDSLVSFQAKLSSVLILF